MTPKIINKPITTIKYKPTLIERVHNETRDFTYEITSEYDDKRRFTVESICRIYGLNPEQKVELITGTAFEVSGLQNTKDSLDLLEQCFYIAYDEFLKIYKDKFKHSPILHLEVAIPDESVVRSDLQTQVLDMLPS